MHREKKRVWLTINKFVSYVEKVGKASGTKIVGRIGKVARTVIHKKPV